jgi:hypothetical protein
MEQQTFAGSRLSNIASPSGGNGFSMGCTALRRGRTWWPPSRLSHGRPRVGVDRLLPLHLPATVVSPIGPGCGGSAVRLARHAAVCRD